MENPWLRLGWGMANALRLIGEGLQQMADNHDAALARLQQDVANLTTVNASAIALITGLADQIRTNATDTDALNSLADSIESQSSTLAAAVTSNTPAQATPPQPPATTDPSAGMATDPTAGTDPTAQPTT